MFVIANFVSRVGNQSRRGGGVISPNDFCVDPIFNRPRRPVIRN
jgi:hypothetical protein